VRGREPEVAVARNERYRTIVWHHTGVSGGR
jgi:hypothetical protein